jgi:hypothetical protein
MLRITKSHSAEGFDKLDKFGTIQEIANDADRLAAIAEKHIEAFKAQRSSLIIAPTHGECRAIAGAVRKAMKEKGRRMSRRDVAIVAWHEVPWERATPKEPSRRVTA